MEITPAFKKNNMMRVIILAIFSLVICGNIDAATLGLGDGFMFGVRDFSIKPAQPLNHIGELIRIKPRIEASANGASWFFLNLNHFISSRVTENLNTSWLTKVTNPSEKIYFSGPTYGGVHGLSDQLPTLADLEWDASNRIVLSYGLGDWCVAGEAQLREVEAVFADYKTKIAALNARLTSIPLKKFSILVAAPFSVQTLYFENNLATKKKPGDQQKTCISPATVTPNDDTDFAIKKMLFENLSASSFLRYCPQLYIPGDAQEKLISQLANHIASLRKKLLETDFKAQNTTVLDLSGLLFETTDLAGNCLTYSDAGQNKVASFVNLNFKTQFKVD